MPDWETEIAEHLTYWKQGQTKLELVFELGKTRVYDTGPNWVIWGGGAQAHFAKNWEEREAQLYPEHERVLWRYLGRLKAIEISVRADKGTYSPS